LRFMAENPSIVATKVPGKGGKYVGSIQLNKPKALNALDHPMAEHMLTCLKTWMLDDTITCVFIHGAGEKAFCAGGDVVSMHNAMASLPNQVPPSVEAFFTTEYELDYTINTYPKPVVVLGHGFVMGGGMGLFCGASHAVVTPSSRLAMPEITIGLFPDVGGTYFLPRLKPGMGLFLGLTGVAFNAVDALHVGLADYQIEDGAVESIIDGLTGIDWRHTKEHAIQVSELLSTLRIPGGAESKLAKYESLLAELDKCDSIEQAADWFSRLDTEDKWISRAVSNFTKGSPITAHLVFEQMRRGSTLSLAEAFKLELNMACTCAELGEFKEGVRALLIEKDNQPKWQYSSVNDVPESIINKHFTPIWSEADHPLRHLQELGA